MQGTLLAVIHPDNTPHGYNLTFAIPVLLFVIVAGGLYLRFRSTHRVPGHVSLASSRWAAGAPAGSGPATPAAQEETEQPEGGAEGTEEGE